jgi:hypothetical protein
MLVYFHAPPSPEMARRPGPRDAGAEVGPPVMAHWFALADRGYHRQHGCSQPPGGPGALRADWQGRGITGVRMATGSGQETHLAVKLGQPGGKGASCPLAVAPSQAQSRPHWCKRKQRVPRPASEGSFRTLDITYQTNTID